MGLEPTTFGITIRCSNQLSYDHHVGDRATKVADSRIYAIEPVNIFYPALF